VAVQPSCDPAQDGSAHDHGDTAQVADPTVKALGGLTPKELVRETWTEQPERFTRDSTQHTLRRDIELATLAIRPEAIVATRWRAAAWMAERSQPRRPGCVGIPALG
jgi:hypothetical protein